MALMGWQRAKRPHSRSADKSRTRSRQLTQCLAKARIVALGIKIISILVAARDRKHPRAQDIVKPMDHPRGITGIVDAIRSPPANPHRALCLRQEQYAVNGSQPPQSKSGCNFLAPSRWEAK